MDLPATTLVTDEAKGYKVLSGDVKGHETVVHARLQYVHNGFTTNHAEGYFSQLKRSIDGTHHHVSKEHLPRYLDEFDYRATTHDLDDSARMRDLMGRTGGRRLTYKPLTSGPDLL